MQFPRTVVKFRRKMPKCYTDKFTIKLQIFRKTLLGINPMAADKCFSVKENIVQFPPKLSEVLKIQKWPQYTLEKFQVKILVAKDMFKFNGFEDCLQTITLTIKNSETTKNKTLTINSPTPRMVPLVPYDIIFNRTCRNESTALTLTYTDATGQEQTLEHTLPALPCDTIAKFFTDNNYRNTIIASSSALLLTTALLTVTILVCRRRKSKWEEVEMVRNQDRNVLYGVYYNDEPEYNVVTDTNDYYES
jgi:hypothetical protein